MTRSMQCLVNGKVQGVFFRAWVLDQATSLGLKGWIRNLETGRVEVLAQGPDTALEELKKRLMQGSTGSRVERVDSKFIDYETAYTEFTIR